MAVLATGAVVAVGVAGSPAAPHDVLAADAHVATDATVEHHRDLVITRDLDTVRGTPEAADISRLEQLLSAKAVSRAIKQADESMWTTTSLNLWTRPDDTAKKVGELASGKKVLLTGRKVDGRQEVVVDGDARWVTTGYLSADKPVGAGAGLSMEPCPDTSVEYRLTAGAVYLYRSVCHAFPQITSYGGWDNHGEHASGKALDIMTSDVALGTAIADWLQAHASELHLYDVIWRQHIWTPERASEGWRAMEDRGSTTANHYDHVHVSVY